MTRQPFHACSPLATFVNRYRAHRRKPVRHKGLMLAMLLMLVTQVALIAPGQALAQGGTDPSILGTDPSTSGANPTADGATPSAAAAEIPNGLKVIVNERGKVSQSIAGVTSIDSTGGNLAVRKPAGATVRAAYFFVASTGFTATPLTSPLSIDGQQTPLANQTPSGISSFNYWSDVTAVVKTKLNAAAAGMVSFHVVEPEPFLTDGEIMVVIYNDPNQLIEQTVSILFGGLSPTGDQFQITLAKPISLSDPATRLEMSLGISYSSQQGGMQQFSMTDVNGQRLTSAAGGQDDGQFQGGALLTVGGEGDSPANPADPNAVPTEPRSDDELYDLKPFVKNGDTSIEVRTNNPSLDDNLFLATFIMNPPVTSIDGVVDHYTVDLKAWIPQERVVDVEQFGLVLPYSVSAAIHTPCYRPPILLRRVTFAYTYYEGDGHASFDGSARVIATMDFDWDGTKISNERHAGHSDPTVLRGEYRTPFNVERCEIARDTAPDRTDAEQVTETTFRLGYKSSKPLCRIPCPAIDAQIDGIVAFDGTVAIHFDTDLFPSHGVRVSRNGITQRTDIVNDVSCIPQAVTAGPAGMALIGPALLSQTNEGDRLIGPDDDGIDSSTKSLFCIK